MFRKRSWVEYGTSQSLMSSVVQPRLASKSLPPKYAKMKAWPNDSANPLMMTVRACLPFRDAMSEGIILPLPFDLTVESSNSGKNLRWWFRNTEHKDYSPSVESHPAAQVDGVTENSVIKLTVPFYIKTSSDVLALYMPLINRESPLIPFSGLVNHADDGYKPNVNLVFKWVGADGTHRFSAGTPLSQVIFLPRNAPSFQHRAMTEKELSEAAEQSYSIALARGQYRRLWRAKRREHL